MLLEIWFLIYGSSYLLIYAISASVKIYCPITLHNFFLFLSFIVSLQVLIFPLNMRDIIIYVARWWEKYLSKRSLIERTCSWPAKLIVSITFFIDYLFLSFSSDCYAYQFNFSASISLCFDLFESCAVLNFLLGTFHLVSEGGFL